MATNSAVGSSSASAAAAGSKVVRVIVDPRSAEAPGSDVPPASSSIADCVVLRGREVEPRIGGARGSPGIGVPMRAGSDVSPEHAVRSAIAGSVAAYARDVLGSPLPAHSPEHAARSAIAEYFAAQGRARRRLADEAVQARRAKAAPAGSVRQRPWVPAATAGVDGLRLASPTGPALQPAQPIARQRGTQGAPQGRTVRAAALRSDETGGRARPAAPSLFAPHPTTSDARAVVHTVLLRRSHISLGVHTRRLHTAVAARSHLPSPPPAVLSGVRCFGTMCLL
eukprot:scaffold3282_cov101-Isochrysis_galbana.AAC.11